MQPTGKNIMSVEIDPYWHKRIRMCDEHISKLSVFAIFTMVLLGTFAFFGMQTIHALRMKLNDVNTRLDNFQRVVAGISRDLRAVQEEMRSRSNAPVRTTASGASTTAASMPPLVYMPEIEDA